MRYSGLVLALALVAVPSVSAAQDGAPEGGAAHSERVAAPADADDDLRLQLTAGASGTYGNARNIAINLAGLFAVRRGQHSFLFEAGWVYGLAATRVDPEMMMYDFGTPNENTNNFTSRLRYDFFLDPDDALFLVAKARRDPFARLEPRITLQAGYLRNFFREENHRFWGEIGYDFTYDRFGTPVPLQVGVDDMGNPVLSDDRALHSLRLYIGYSNHLTDTLTYDTGLEALMRLDRPEHWRFEWTNQIRSKIEDWLQISIDVTVRVDSLPPGQAEAWNEQANQATQMTDLLATLNLVGTFDLDGTPAEEEEEEPECPACVCPAPEPCPAVAEAAPEAETPTVEPEEPEGEVAPEPTDTEPTDALAE